MSSSTDVVTNVQQLIETTNLKSINFFRLHAERFLDAAAEPPEFAIDPKYAMGIEIRSDDSAFRVSLSTEISTPIGNIACGVLAEYEHPGVVLRAESAPSLTEFVNGVVVMHILPYARQGIADLTQRTFNAPLLMPMIQRGQLEFKVDIEDDPSRA